MFGQHLHLEEEHETSITVQQHWQQPQMTAGLIRPFHCSAGLLCLPWKTFDWKSSEDIVSNQGCWGRTWNEKKKEKIPQMSQVINSRYITTSQTENNNKKKKTFMLTDCSGPESPWCLHSSSPLRCQICKSHCSATLCTVELDKIDKVSKVCDDQASEESPTSGQVKENHVSEQQQQQLVHFRGAGEHFSAPCCPSFTIHCPPHWLWLECLHRGQRRGTLHQYVLCQC